MEEAGDTRDDRRVTNELPTDSHSISEFDIELSRRRRLTGLVDDSSTSTLLVKGTFSSQVSPYFLNFESTSAGFFVFPYARTGPLCRNGLFEILSMGLKGEEVYSECQILVPQETVNE